RTESATAGGKVEPGCAWKQRVRRDGAARRAAVVRPSQLMPAQPLSRPRRKSQVLTATTGARLQSAPTAPRPERSPWSYSTSRPGVTMTTFSNLSADLITCAPIFRRKRGESAPGPGTSLTKQLGEREQVPPGTKR